MSWLGAELPVFIGVTLVVFGGASMLMGQALARTWRPMWQILPYGLLLGCADRFITYALFDGDLLALSGFIVACVVLIAMAATSYRISRTTQMVRQYPWIYERAGPMAWREKSKT